MVRFTRRIKPAMHYFFISGGRPVLPCCPMGRLLSCSNGSFIWEGGFFLFFRRFGGGDLFFPLRGINPPLLSSTMLTVLGRSGAPETLPSVQGLATQIKRGSSAKTRRGL
jgi:hypothetical protein